MGRVPGILVFAAWLSIVWGALGLCCNPISLLGGAMQTGSEEVPLFGVTITTPPAARWIGLVGDLIDLATAAAIVGFGFATLKLHPIARPGMIVTAVVITLNKTIIHIAHAIAMAPASAQMAEAIMPGVSQTGMTEVGAIMGGLCMLPFVLAYPVFILVVYNLKVVRDAFTYGGLPPEGPGGGYWQEQPQYTGQAWPAQAGWPQYPPQQQWPANPQQPQGYQQPPEGWGAPPPPAAPPPGEQGGGCSFHRPVPKGFYAQCQKFVHAQF